MNRSDTNRRAPSIKYQPKSKRSFFDVGIGSVCLSGADAGGEYCLLEVSLAPGMGVPRHTHTREDEAYFSPSGFEDFLKATAIPAPDNAVAPTEPPAVAVRNILKLAADDGIRFV
jgi:hypothetical protein